MTDNHIDRRTYLAGPGAAGVADLTGCSGGPTAAVTGTLATAVTDQPGDIANFESCVVTIVGIWLGPGGDQSSDGGEMDESEAGDMDGEDEDGSREYYEFDEPQEADLVDLPGNTPLKFNEAFEIRANTRTMFIAEFTPVKRGNSGWYNLQPVARGVTVEYEELNSESSGNETDQNETAR